MRDGDDVASARLGERFAVRPSANIGIGLRQQQNASGSTFTTVWRLTLKVLRRLHM